MDNFDLKKYLVENKRTTNSRMLNEKEESKKPSIKVLRNLYYFDKLGSVAAKEDIDEKYHKDSNLVFKKGTTVKDDTKHDDSEYEMIIKSKRLKKGTDYKMLTESEEGKHSKMMKENENPVDSGVAQFPQLVKKYGEEAVRTALDVAYENTWYNIHDVSHDTMDDEEVDMQARAEFKDQIKFFKQNPAALEDLISDTIDSMEEGKKAKHSKMMKESKAVKKVTAGGITYKVGDDDPEDEGIIMYIDKHKNGYFITGGTFRDPHDYAEGEEPNEGYGYAIDFEGNRIDEDDLD